MNADALLDAVRKTQTTELSRLGSSKALYAATGGEIEADTVLRAAADAERAAAETFESWADDEPSEAARDVFRTTAEEERDHFERVLAEIDDYDPAADPPALPAHLRGLDDTVDRVGALLGRVLVARESKTQYVGYFVGDADPQTASVFRELKGDLDGKQERTLELLETVCESDADWERAEAAAEEAVQVAYDAYVEQLESMGVDPKPVC